MSAGDGGGTPTAPSEPSPLSAGGIALRVALAAGILIGANLVPMVVTSVLLQVPALSELFGGSSPWGFVLAAAMQVVVLTVVVLALAVWMRRVERRPLRAAGWEWTRGSTRALLVGIAVSALIVIAVTAALPSTGDSLGGAPGTDPDSLTTATALLLIVYYLGLAFVQQAIPEELLFRGWLLRRLRDRPVVAIGITTAAFTVIHLGSQAGQQSAIEHVLYLAVPLGFSLLAVGAQLWFRSLWAAVGVHGGFHVGSYVCVVLLPTVDPVTSWLAIGACQTVLGVVLIVTALRRGRGLALESQAISAPASSAASE